MRTDDLIAQLTDDLEPVRRVAPPWRAALAWFGLAALLIGAAVAWSGFRHDIAERLMVPEERLNLVAAALTGMAAAFAAFQLAMPDRSTRWTLLPLPFAALWLSGLGWGCLRDMVENGWPALSTSFGCTRFILGFGLPLTALILWMARHATPMRPAPVAALGGLAAAAISSVGLSLVHHLDAAAMVLIWHGSAIALVTALGWFWGPSAMRAIGRASAASAWASVNEPSAAGAITHGTSSQAMTGIVMWSDTASSTSGSSKAFATRSKSGRMGCAARGFTRSRVEEPCSARPTRASLPASVAHTAATSHTG